jgi:eukaryotic-like serine/threonine-protein kinase
VSSPLAENPERVIDGKYGLIRKLGSGAAGSVWEAEHLIVGKRVAIKVLDPELAKSPALRTRFVAEARAAARIAHANVVDIYDLGVARDGTSFMVMELLEGETLEQVIGARGAIPAAYACELMLQVLAGLGAAHARGIVHRDLKPANVIVTHPRPDRPHVKVLDFGIAKGVVEAAAENTEQPMLLGTPLYMAPEQALGSDVDARSDVYAAGAMLYEMLAGRAAFAGDTTREVVARVLAGSHTPLARAQPNVPAELASLVEAALSREPRLRPGSAEELAERLSAFVAAPHALSLLPQPSLGAQPIPLVGLVREGRWLSNSPLVSAPASNVPIREMARLTASFLDDPQIPKSPLLPRLESAALPLVKRNPRFSVGRRLTTQPAARRNAQRRNLVTALVAALAGFGIGLAAVALSGAL